jgi:hypothetical protein
MLSCEFFTQLQTFVISSLRAKSRKDEKKHSAQIKVPIEQKLKIRFKGEYQHHLPGELSA